MNKFQKLLTLVVLLLLVVVTCWWIRESGKNIDTKVQVLKDGNPLANTLVEVTSITRYLHWWDEPFFSGDYSLKIRKIGLQKTFVYTDRSGLFSIKGHAVAMSISVFSGALKYCVFDEKLTCLTRIPRIVELNTDASQPPAPAYVWRSIEESLPAEKEGASNDKRTGRGENKSIHCARILERSAYKYIQNKRLLAEYVSKFGVIYVELDTVMGDKRLMDGLPYQVRFSDTKEVYVKWVTVRDRRGLSVNPYIWLYVPNNRKYDLEILPQERKWPGISEDDKVAPERLLLRKRLVRDIMPSVNPAEPMLTLNFDADFQELATAKKRALEEERAKALRREKGFYGKLRMASRSLMEHWALVLLVLVPFVAPWIVRRVLGSREKKADKDR